MMIALATSTQEYGSPHETLADCLIATGTTAEEARAGIIAQLEEYGVDADEYHIVIRNA